MIPASELRVGNWIGYKGNHFIITDGLVKIELFGWQVIIEDNEIDLNDCSPIHLTPEILEKLGFKNKKNSSHSMFYTKGKFSIRYHANTGNFFTKINEYMLELTSLHQLQNLYFALTGEELKYKP